MPLSLDDAALARLAIAAGRVPQRARGQWLRRLAREAAAEQRRRNGVQ